MTRPTTIKKSQKVITDKDGKTRIVEDFQKQRRMKPAGQQFFKKDSVRVKRK